MEFLEFKLPPPGVPAGRVLQHAKRTMASLFSKHDPMIFKFGFCRNALWRWANDLYGYKFSRDRWTNMVVMFESNEPHGPAMLEATLIDLFGSSLVRTDFFSDFVYTQKIVMGFF